MQKRETGLDLEQVEKLNYVYSFIAAMNDNRGKTVAFHVKRCGPLNIAILV